MFYYLMIYLIGFGGTFSFVVAVDEEDLVDGLQEDQSIIWPLFASTFWPLYWVGILYFFLTQNNTNQNGN